MKIEEGERLGVLQPWQGEGVKNGQGREERKQRWEDQTCVACIGGLICKCQVVDL